MERFGSWERDSWSFWHQKQQFGAAGKAHCLDVSSKRICSETAHIGITLPLCFRNNSWLEKGIFKMKELLVSPNLRPGKSSGKPFPERTGSEWQ